VLWFSVSLSKVEQAVMLPVTPLWFVALSLFDMATYLSGVTNGQPTFEANRGHFHQLILSAGFSVGQTMLIVSVMALVLAITGTAGLYFGVPENAMFALFLGAFAC